MGRPLVVGVSLALIAAGVVAKTLGGASSAIAGVAIGLGAAVFAVDWMITGRKAAEYKAQKASQTIPPERDHVAPNLAATVKATSQMLAVDKDGKHIDPRKAANGHEKRP